MTVAAVAAVAATSIHRRNPGAVGSLGRVLEGTVDHHGFVTVLG